MKTVSLHHEEMVMQSFRQSKAVLVVPVLITIILLYLPWVQSWKFHVIEQLRPFLFIWSIGVIIYFLRALLIWHRIRFYITTGRLIKLYHEGLFKKTFVETPLDRILNVSYKTTGFWSSILGFGNVEVQVVGLIEPIIFQNVSRPGPLKDYIWKAHERAAKSNPHRFDSESISHIQQQIGYTKKDQRIV